ncbi:hypothetical protein AAL_03848 [Moelleriella libera RCEF 2490]|uniref:Uncharacterized protein n=1 Tax=Moelleriella libera RCEF 2490 TaxID=1081109 RepID=A0A168CHS8_9HYPO|nr:hypothetical protein AAL_03848 [Moelleriella libera RCEF 2490]
MIPSGTTVFALAGILSVGAAAFGTAPHPSRSSTTALDEAACVGAACPPPPPTTTPTSTPPPLDKRIVTVQLSSSRHEERAVREPKEKGSINCQLLLRQGGVNCARLSPKTCQLVRWLYAQKECAMSSGTGAKRCCDGADNLPFGAGVYYTGYMRACAPQYQLQRFDRPVFRDRKCTADYNCDGHMSQELCDMRRWESAGCRRRTQCQSDAEDQDKLSQCCSAAPRRPEGLHKQLFQSRFEAMCRHPSTTRKWGLRI